jgi:DNA invertase Pin-like site-specific DNA recombinase
MSLRAVIWCAVSTLAQTADDKDSLPSQETAARELCKQNGWVIADVLIVPGHSRFYIDIHDCAHDMAAKGINAFYRLIELWEQEAFDVLVCRDFNRFARRPVAVQQTLDR